MSARQADLFGAAPTTPKLPEGFRYQPDVISAAEEQALLGAMAQLPFKEFDFHGFLAKRRVVSFGWKYDYAKRDIERVEDIPDFLLELRATAAAFAGMRAERLQQVLINEYRPGAGIGWHRDKAQFGEVIGISLVSPAVFRLRRKVGSKWERASITVQPRSAYLLSGASRTEWEHSVPEVDRLRYSVTFRNFRDGVPAE